MRAPFMALLLFATPGLAQAVDCSSLSAPRTAPPRAALLAPISPEFATPSRLLGAQSGVLAHAYDESQSVDEVLLRLRVEGCRSVAIAIPAPSVLDPNDPSVYKPKTEFDNTPWRFDMNQNGKRMTADEFDAWMKSRGVRVARGKVPAPTTTVDPTAVPVAAPGTVPVPAPGAVAPVLTPATPAPVPAPAPPTPAVQGGQTPQ